jgi:hypothetical protein
MQNNRNVKSLEFLRIYESENQSKMHFALINFKGKRTLTLLLFDHNQKHTIYIDF